jgi:hypothetical protein
MIDLNKMMTDEVRAKLGVDQMTALQRETLVEWAVWIYQIGKNSSIVSGWIDEIKYGGHLIILNDDSRWEVDESDTDTAGMWSMLDDVVVIDDTMYRLDQLEKVSVTRE